MKIIDYNKKKPRLCYGNVCFITSQKIMNIYIYTNFYFLDISQEGYFFRSSSKIVDNPFQKMYNES